MKYAIITRQLEESQELARTLLTKGYQPVIEPLFTIKLYDDININKNYDYYIITSKNAARWLKNNHHPQKAIIAVGDATSEELAKYNHNIINCSGTAKDIANYIRINIPISSKILYLRGQNIAFNIKQNLDNYNIDEAIIYESLATDNFSNNIKEICESDNIIIFLSAKTAETFVKLATLYDIQPNSIAYVLSQNIKNILQTLTWGDIIVSDIPTLDNLLQKIPPHGKNQQQ
jgi:uroporphyrinogen-III synthase